MKNLKVVELRVENFMGVELAEVRPDGEALVIVGGDNGQGKTSLLNGLECAIRGKKYHPERPVRDGAESAEVCLDLGELKIRRRFKAEGGGSISVENAEGMRPKRPQDLLDALADAIAFDPLEFSRMKPAERLEMVRALSGVDLSEVEQARERAYADRTDANREAKRLEAQLAGMPYHEGSPEAEVSVSELLERLQSMQSAKDQNWKKTQEAREADEEHRAQAERRQQLERELEESNWLEELARRRCEALVREVDELQDPDTEPVEAELRGASAVNQQVRENQARAGAAEELEEHKRQSHGYTEAINQADKDKAALLASAALPIEGLSFGDDGVTLNGVPFSQISSAEQLRASVAMGIALNPKLHVMLVRDGSLLDSKSMELLATLASLHGYQMWIERVGSADAGAIVIEEGRVVGAEEATA